ncbi:MAG: DUF1043 family protein [Hahellaceae bacterium]|jgi:uncharacterized membrane-anchored protein YhcB (DUF1043 family)|nr:DUF1043 family protein [Hahellaceae bacterium]MCP5211235.1 DUF1043 family protein [Hahellaceae bacterium]
MNELLTSTYAIAMLCFVSGIGTGILIKHLAGSPERQKRKLTQEVEEAEKKHLFYQSKVSVQMSKFHEISAKLEQLQLELQHQLSESDAALFPEAEETFAEQEDDEPAFKPANLLQEKSASLTTPMDYADKSRANESKLHKPNAGTLSESFGLQSETPKKSA